MKSKGRKQKAEGTRQKAGRGRRTFVLLGAGALATAGIGLAGAYNAGWFDSEQQSPAPTPSGRDLTPVSLPADHQNALGAANDLLEHYARDLGNPSVLVHAVRGLGKDFELADGSNAVDHLCSRYAADKEVNGKRYVYFKRHAEVHENSFLKTFLEAGVGFDQPITAGAGKYTLRDLADCARALFRCDPEDLDKYDDSRFRYDTSSLPPKQTAAGQAAIDPRGELIHEHLPWGLISFSILMPPDKASWTNAYGELINLPAVIDSSLREYESTCSLGVRELAMGEAAPKAFREAIKKYSCFGLHTAYGYLVCLRNGYRVNDLSGRVNRMMDLVTHRLKGDAQAIDREYAQEGGGSPPQIVEAFRVRALVKFYGHAFEAINYAKLNNLVAFTPGQVRRIEAGEQAFYQSIVKMRSLDWAMMRKSLGDKFISDIVIALGHAARALKRA